MSESRGELDDLATRLADGLLAPEERSQVLNRATAEGELAAAIERDARLEASLRSAFAPPPATFRGEAQALPEVVPASPPLAEREAPSRRRVLWYALAASVAWGVLGWQWLRQSGPQRIAFFPRPLTEVYQTCVAEGFQPYWVCEDDAVFAATFQRRQGVALGMLKLPLGSAMAGLSYLGGLSEDSTAMLAHVDGKPVIVVVDRIKNDWRPPVGPDGATGLYVFREERAGLALYEVSPFPQPRLLKFFQPLAAGGQE